MGVIDPTTTNGGSDETALAVNPGRLFVWRGDRLQRPKVFAGGELLTVEVSAVPLDRGGQVIGIFGQIKDVEDEPPPPPHPHRPIRLPGSSTSAARRCGITSATAKGDAYVAAAEEMTDRINAVIKAIAAASESAYVDLRAAFKGPSYSYDETHYLSSDGDHPNKAGHKKIATATQAVIDKALHI